MDVHPCPNGTGILHYQKGLHSGNAPDISENSLLKNIMLTPLVVFLLRSTALVTIQLLSCYHNQAYGYMHFDISEMHTVLFVFLTRGTAYWPQITVAKKIYAVCIAQKAHNPKPNHILFILGLLNDAFNS
jgi:hypothetical protein